MTIITSFEAIKTASGVGAYIEYVTNDTKGWIASSLIQNAGCLLTSINSRNPLEAEDAMRTLIERSFNIPDIQNGNYIIDIV